MIELIQFPWSPFCIVQRRILEFARARFQLVDVPSGERSLVWKITRQRYYQVPVLKDGKTVVFETDEDSQVIAKFLDNQLQLGLFPSEWAGIQRVLWRYIENEIQGCTFRLNDIHWQENVPKADRLAYLRHKERKFGCGCFDQWRTQQRGMLDALATALIPFDQMLATKDFLLDGQPRFVDFDLCGMLSNFLYSGHYSLPKAHTQLRRWHERMAKVKRPLQNLA